MVWANLCAAACSRGRSFFVLKLVSIARMMESGNADSRLKIAIRCSLPSSLSRKFSFWRLATGPPCESVTVTKTLTSLTSTLSVVSGSCATQARVVAPTIRASHSFFMQGQSFGCGLHAGCAGWARNFFREWLAIRPDRAIFEVFFFPDGNGLLEGVDDPAAGLKCGSAMGRGHHDQNAGLADFQPPQTVYK